MVRMAQDHFTKFEAELPGLMAQINEGQSGRNIMCELRKISGADLYYTDGAAINYDALLMVSVRSTGRSYSSYFSFKDPDHTYGSLPDNIETIIKKWRHKVFEEIQPLVKEVSMTCVN